MKPAVIFKISLFIPALLFLFVCRTHAETVDPYAQTRRDMVRFQIRDRGISDAGVIRAMEMVPRHEFVPEAEKKYAYDDRPLPVGYGRPYPSPISWP